MAQVVKSPPTMWKTWVQYLGWEDPLEEGNGNPLQYSSFLPGESRGQRSLVGYSPWGHTEWDTTERVTLLLLLKVTLCDPVDCTVHGILQARILEWVAFPLSRGSSQSRDRTQDSCIAGRIFTIQATREDLVGRN